MSGEINLDLNGAFGDAATVVLTRARLDQLISGLAARIQENSITARELADGALSLDVIPDGLITSDKIADLAVISAKIAAQAVLTEKIIDGAITRDKLNSAVLPQVSEVYNSGPQTLTAGAGVGDVTDLSVTVTPHSANSRFLLVSKLSMVCTSGGTLTGNFVDAASPGTKLGSCSVDVGASGKQTLTIFHLISPATGSAVTFKVQAGAATNDIDLLDASSSLLVQEII